MTGVVIVGIPVFLLSLMLMQNSRRYEIGVYYSLGISKNIIAFSMFSEYVISMFPVLVLSRILSRFAVRYLISVKAVPDITPYLRGSVPAAVMAVPPLFILLVPAAVLYRKIAKTDPISMIKGE